MAIKNNATSQTASSNSRTATAFLNLSVIDKSGKEHRLNNGVALYANVGLDAAIIEKFTNDPEAELTLKVRDLRLNVPSEQTFDL